MPESYIFVQNILEILPQQYSLLVFVSYENRLREPTPLQIIMKKRADFGLPLQGIEQVFRTHPLRKYELPE